MILTQRAFDSLSLAIGRVAQALDAPTYRPAFLIPSSVYALTDLALKSGYPEYHDKVHVADGENHVAFTVTNGNAMVRVTFPRETVEEYPMFDGVPATTLDSEAVLPVDTLRAFLKTAKDGPRSLPILRKVACAINGDITFAHTDLTTPKVVKVPKSDKKFPVVDKCIPRKKPVFSIHLNPILLVETLQVMVKTLSERPVQPCFTFEFYGEEQPVLIKAKSLDSETTELGLVMPMRD
ncbi:MAG: hypothetical protein HYT87_13015 [Nitrospirae bacterium]|nr:hypothetical protein [Nitrospirota bacterium]